jgi:hypothetical protein
MYLTDGALATFIVPPPLAKNLVAVVFDGNQNVQSKKQETNTTQNEDSF